MQCILQMAFYLAAAGASDFPLSGLSINSKLGLKELTPASHSSVGFQTTLVGERLEIVVKGTALPSEELAKTKAAKDLVHIQGLYEARINPYEGQVSDLVQCPVGLKPKLAQVSVKAVHAKPTLLVGGVSSRKMFGVCAKDQVAYWGGYFQFYYPAQKMAVEVRIFDKSADKGTPAQAFARLKTISETLFAPSEAAQ
jgi:hypothetical protein